MASEEVKYAARHLPVELDNISEKIRLFSFSLRSLYAEDSVGTSSDSAIKFRKLRDDTRNAAVIYIHGIMPQLREFISDIKKFFSYYRDLNFEDWLASIKFIINKVEVHIRTCKRVIALHSGILIQVKESESKAKVLLSEMEDLSIEYARSCENLRRNSELKMNLALVFSNFPTVGEIAAPMLALAAHFDLVNSTGLKHQAEIQFAAVSIVRETLVPAISEFIEGLHDISGFLSVTQDELQAFHGHGMEVMKSDSPVQMHYKLMRGNADRVMDMCNKFFATLPAVCTDLEAIPKKGTDRNYVDNWMKNQIKEISQNMLQPEIDTRLEES